MQAIDKMQRALPCHCLPTMSVNDPILTSFDPIITECAEFYDLGLRSDLLQIVIFRITTYFNINNSSLLRRIENYLGRTFLFDNDSYVDEL